MAPPLGRLRVLQSLEVDEDDAEYQRKKQETQQTLKSTFEAIFEKYSNVADHETDEVDLHAGTIVVDNGHLRKLAKDPKVRERWMALGEIMEDEFEDGDSDSEDELAELAMPPITIRRKVSSSEPASSPLQDTQSNDTPSAQTVPDVPPLTLDPTQLLSTLIHLPQMSQQPALSSMTVNPEQQNAFLMGLGQSVWQTITQSLAQTSPTSLGSAFGRITSSPSLSQASRVAELPPTDPKWQYPPLPELPVRARLPQSRPQATSSLGKRRAPFADGQQHREKVQRADSASLPASAPLPTPKSVDKPSEAEKDELDTVIRGSPRHRTSVAAQPCHLSDEDIQHITTLLERTGMSLEQIWETKVAWRKWPLRIFRQHYLQHSREEIDLNSEEAPFSLPGEGFCQTPETHVPTPRPFSEKDFASLSPIKSSVETLRKSRRTRKQPAPVSEIQNCDASHLPTPNLTSHSGETDTEKDNDQGEPTSSHTDEEDDPGLQVATGDEPLIEHDEPIMTSPPPEELVIPSIENDDPQDDSQDELLEPQCPIKYPRVEVRIPRVKPPAPDRNDTFIPQSSPPRCEPPVANTTADSDSDIDLVPTVLPVEAEATDSEKTAPDMNDDDEQVDELAAPFIPSTPITPRIKREPVSPELSSLLTVPRPSTPISAPQLSRPDSSGSKSTSRLSKSHIARLARAQWAKQGRSGTPLRAKQRRSLGEALPRRAGQEDSDDELAM